MIGTRLSQSRAIESSVLIRMGHTVKRHRLEGVVKFEGHVGVVQMICKA